MADCHQVFMGTSSTWPMAEVGWRHREEQWAGGQSHRGRPCPEPWQRWVQQLRIPSGEHAATVTATSTVTSSTTTATIIPTATSTTPPIAAFPHWDMFFFSVVIALWWWLSLLAVFPAAQINLSLSQDNPCL